MTSYINQLLMKGRGGVVEKGQRLALHNNDDFNWEKEKKKTVHELL